MPICYINPDGSHVRGCDAHLGEHPWDWCRDKGVRRDPRNESRVEMSMTPRSAEEQRIWDVMQEARQNTARERKDWGS